MARIIKWRIVRKESRIEQPMRPLGLLTKHETAPNIRTFPIQFEVKVRNICWLVEHDARDLARDVTHVIPAEGAAWAAEMARPTALNGEQKARCLYTSPGEDDRACLDPRVAVSTSDHDAVDHTPAHIDVKI